MTLRTFYAAGLLALLALACVGAQQPAAVGLLAACSRRRLR